MDKIGVTWKSCLLQNNKIYNFKIKKKKLLQTLQQQAETSSIKWIGPKDLPLRGSFWPAGCHGGTGWRAWHGWHRGWHLRRASPGTPRQPGDATKIHISNVLLLTTKENQQSCHVCSPGPTDGCPPRRPTSWMAWRALTCHLRLWGQKLWHTSRTWRKMRNGAFRWSWAVLGSSGGQKQLLGAWPGVRRQLSWAAGQQSSGTCGSPLRLLFLVETSSSGVTQPCLERQKGLKSCYWRHLWWRRLQRSNISSSGRKANLQGSFWQLFLGTKRTF